MANATERPTLESFSCNDYNDYRPCPCPQGDPDIAGIGVFAVSLGTTLFTGLLAIASSTSRGGNAGSFIDRITNRLLQFLKKQNRRLLLVGPKATRDEASLKRIKHVRTLLRAVGRSLLITLNDQALVFGIALLIIQFTGLSSMAYTYGEFSLVRDLALLASMTQLIGMEALLPLFSGIDLSPAWDYALSNPSTLFPNDDVGLSIFTGLSESTNTLFNVVLDKTSERRRPLLITRLSRVFLVNSLFVFVCASNSITFFGRFECPARCVIQREPFLDFSIRNASIIIVIVPTTVYFSLSLFKPGIKYRIMFWVLKSRLKVKFRECALKLTRLNASSIKEPSKAVDGIAYGLVMTCFAFTSALALSLAGTPLVLLWVLITSSTYTSLVAYLMFLGPQTGVILVERVFQQLPGDGCPPLRNEAQWTNAQIIPVILVMLPLLNSLQMFSDETIRLRLEEDETEEEHHSSQGSTPIATNPRTSRDESSEVTRHSSQQSNEHRPETSDSSSRLGEQEDAIMMGGLIPQAGQSYFTEPEAHTDQNDGEGVHRNLAESTSQSRTPVESERTRSSRQPTGDSTGVDPMQNVNAPRRVNTAALSEAERGLSPVSSA